MRRSTECHNPSLILVASEPLKTYPLSVSNSDSKRFSVSMRPYKTVLLVSVLDCLTSALPLPTIATDPMSPSWPSSVRNAVVESITQIFDTYNASQDITKPSYKNLDQMLMEDVAADINQSSQRLKDDIEIRPNSTSNSILSISAKRFFFLLQDIVPQYVSLNSSALPNVPVIELNRGQEPVADLFVLRQGDYTNMTFEYGFGLFTPACCAAKQ